VSSACATSSNSSSTTRQSNFFARPSTRMRRRAYRRSLFRTSLAPSVQRFRSCHAQHDAILVQEILGLLRVTSIPKIRRRAKDDHWNVRAYAYSNHVLRDLVTEADPDVISFFHDVQKPAIDGDFDFSIGVGRQNSSQFRPGDRLDGIIRRGVSDHPCRLVPEVGKSSQVGSFSSIHRATV
jgi:hypothetical protein